MNACKMKTNFECSRDECEFKKEGKPIDWVDTYRNCTYFDCGSCRNELAQRKEIDEFINVMSYAGD